MTKEPRGPTRQELQTRATVVSICGSAAMFLLIAAAGIITDSITLLLDAATNFVIFAVALLTYFSVQKVHRPPDHRYNFGYTKFEPFTVAIQAGLIIMTCVVSVNFAIQDIMHPDDITGYGLPVIVEAFSAIVSFALMWYMALIGRRTQSAMLKGASMQWKIETLFSVGIAAGFLIGLFLKAGGYTHITPYIDPAMAIILAAFFLREPLKAMGYSVPELLDAAPAGHIQEAVRKVVDKYTPRSFGVTRLRTRKAGGKVFVDVCFLVKSDMTVVETAELAENLQRDIEEHLPESDVLVHFRHKR